MARPPVCPLCGQKVPAKWRHITCTVLPDGSVAAIQVRHTQPCPKSKLDDLADDLTALELLDHDTEAFRL